MALAEADALHGDDAERGEAAMLDTATATRIRHQRAAFDPGPLMLPPGPAAPAGDDRGLANWPIRNFDLVDLTPPSGGEILLSSREIARWGLFLKAEPSFEARLARVEQMFAIADRLRGIAKESEADPHDLRLAREGALILAYLAAAQIAIWPALKYSAEAATKERLVTIINERASRGDPGHMQAAIRHLYTGGRLARPWLATYRHCREPAELDPDHVGRLHPPQSSTRQEEAVPRGAASLVGEEREIGRCSEQPTPHEKQIHHDD